MTKTIRLKEDNILRVDIENYDGTPTGEYLEFDLEDIELLLKYQKCLEMHKSNINQLKMKFTIVDKKQDKTGKKLLSANEEEKIKIYKEFYEKEMIAMDLFLGEGGCKKLLNGRKPYYSMFEDINELIQPILPELDLTIKNLGKKITEKYSTKEKNVLE